MNIYLIISIIIGLFLVSEWELWYNRKSDWMAYIYFAMIRLSIVIFTIASIGYIAFDHNEVNAINEHNHNLIEHFDSLRVLQTEMIDSMANHLWNEHDCDLPMFDGDLLDNINEQETKIDSIIAIEK